MFTILLETRHRRAYSPREAIISLGLHLGLIIAAVLLTADTGTAHSAPPVPEHVIYAPPPAAPTPRVPVSPSLPRPGTGNPPLVRVEVFIAPVEVPIGLPPVASGDPAPWSTAPATPASPDGSTIPGGAIGAWTDAQVEKPAMALPGSPLPVYPDFLRSSGTEGDVLVQYVVDTLGRVEAGSFRALHASHALFAQSVERVLPRLRFIPAEVGGRRVRQWVQQPFAFAIAK